MNVYDFTVKDIQGHDVSLSQYKDKVLLIVNTASKCGFTPQYDGLEALYQKYKDKGLVILGFPCNQFLEQDPEDNQHIEQFCRLNHAYVGAKGEIGYWEEDGRKGQHKSYDVNQGSDLSSYYQSSES